MQKEGGRGSRLPLLAASQGTDTGVTGEVEEGKTLESSVTRSTGTLASWEFRSHVSPASQTPSSSTLRTGPENDLGLGHRAAPRACSVPAAGTGSPPSTCEQKESPEEAAGTGVFKSMQVLTVAFLSTKVTAWI